MDSEKGEAIALAILLAVMLAIICLGPWKW